MLGKPLSNLKRRVMKLVGDQFKVLGEYQDTDKKSKCHTLHEKTHFVYKMCFLRSLYYLL